MAVDGLTLDEVDGDAEPGRGRRKARQAVAAPEMRVVRRPQKGHASAPQRDGELGRVDGEEEVAVAQAHPALGLLHDGRGRVRLADEEPVVRQAAPADLQTDDAGAVEARTERAGLGGADGGFGRGAQVAQVQIAQIAQIMLDGARHGHLAPPRSAGARTRGRLSGTG